ncbi:hypothetical protein [Gordonia sp. (in: high G+C Gram-positive bacteria)]|uniref:hypothetical protein n=1 Tax=Gordonia sp. (in: high G+C Gram-positive bacteria) TaxID=84139 RepID=UPI003C7605AB
MTDHPSRPQSSPTALRLALLIPGGLALLAGLDAALLLLGVGAPITAGRLAEVHGPLMVYGFVGTLVALERAVALGRAWGFLAPAGLGLGGLALIAVEPSAIGGGLLVFGSAVLVAVYVPLWQRNTATAVLVQAAGAVLAVGGALLFAAGLPMPWLIPWLAGYLILTIGGERLELARVAFAVGNAETGALLACAAVFLAVPATLLWPHAGYRVFGAAVLVFTVWLLRYDIARRTVRTTGLTRFSAFCLLGGYGWLLVAGGVWLIAGPVRQGPGYDAAAHAVFLGFVMSMILAHAPIILPAVLRRPLPYHPIMYVPAVLLHPTLALRIVVGDGADALWAVQAGGVGNVIAVLAFVVIAIGSVLWAPRRKVRTARAATDSDARATGSAPSDRPEREATA